MPEGTLAIVFRNPHPQRSPIDNELYLIRRDGSSKRVHYSDQSESQGHEEPARAKRFHWLENIF